MCSTILLCHHSKGRSKLVYVKHEQDSKNCNVSLFKRLMTCKNRIAKFKFKIH